MLPERLVEEFEDALALILRQLLDLGPGLFECGCVFLALHELHLCCRSCREYATQGQSLRPRARRESMRNGEA